MPSALRAAESYPKSEVRDSSLECQAAKVQEQLRGDTPRLRSGAAAGRSNLMPKARAVTRRSNPSPRSGGCPGTGGAIPNEGQEGQWEEIPLIQGKKQRLCFAGAAVKRYPTPKVRETQVKW